LERLGSTGVPDASIHLRSRWCGARCLDNPLAATIIGAVEFVRRDTRRGREMRNPRVGQAIVEAMVKGMLQEVDALRHLPSQELRTKR